MGDDFNFDDFMNGSDSDGYGDRDPDYDGLAEKIEAFQNKVKDTAMREAYNFIEEVGILFWVRRDMYVKNDRKTNILNSMILYFQETEEYEKCAYLVKGLKAIELFKKETTKTK